jgi:hypothetical protein
VTGSAKTIRILMTGTILYGLGQLYQRLLCVGGAFAVRPGATPQRKKDACSLRVIGRAAAPRHKSVATFLGIFADATSVRRSGQRRQ